MTDTRQLLCAAFIALSVVGCARQPSNSPADGDELPTLSVTHWTDKTELFMEYPPLVAGRTSLFAVHLTAMEDFKPVAAGRARVEFVPESGGTAKTLVGPSPSRAGAFRVEDVPPAPGRYRWALVLEGSGCLGSPRPRVDHCLCR